MGIIKGLVKSVGGNPLTQRLQTYAKSNGASLFDYKKSYVFACMNIRAMELANADLRFYENEEELKNPEHWANILKQNPNSNYVWSDLAYNISMWLDLKGNAYVLPQYITIGGKNVIAELQIIPANRVTINGVGTKVISYNVNLGKGSFKVPAEDMIHIKDMSPSEILTENFYEGQSDLVNAVKDVHEIIQKKLDFMETYYSGDGVMPFILGVDNDEITSSEARQFLNDYNSTIKSPKYQAQAFMPMGIRPLPLSDVNGGANSVNSESLANLREIVSAVFFVADTILTGKYNTRATANDTIQVLNEKVTDPRANKIAQYFNQYFKRLTDVRIKHNPKLFRNDEFELRKTSTLYNNGAIDLDEYREANGYEKTGLKVLENPNTPTAEVIDLSEKKTSIQTRSIGTKLMQK